MARPADGEDALASATSRARCRRRNGAQYRLYQLPVYAGELRGRDNKVILLISCQSTHARNGSCSCRRGRGRSGRGRRT
eukprot:2348582-Pleurochrysis_carterae.AAC.1